MENSYINEYVGNVTSEKAFLERLNFDYIDDVHHFSMQLERGLVIDAYRMGNGMRFVNHSCEPNCRIEKWIVRGIPRMCLFANQNIKAGDEITFDYKFSLYSNSDGQNCLCGALNCRRTIGNKK